jgi:hypothetical protein
LQRVFAAALIEGDAPTLTPWIAARGIAPEARLRIYRNAGYAIHVEALEQSFAATRQFVGEDCFDGLATRFSARHGSTSGNLQHFGADFPDFIHAQPETAAYPWLLDVARLEWLRQESLLAAADDAAAANADPRAAMASSDGEVSLRLSAHVRVLDAEVPALDLWRYAHDPEHAPPPDPDGGPQCVLLWREHAAIAMCEISAAQAACIAALRGGNTLEAALGIRDHDAIAACLQPLIEHALIRGITAKLR